MLPIVLLVISLFFEIICIPNICSDSNRTRLNIEKPFNSSKHNNEKLKSKHKSDTKTNTSPQLKTWQVSRANRKHYEIMNTICLKTNMCVNNATDILPEILMPSTNIEESIIRGYQREDYPSFFIQPPKLLSSTPSYIEFYYLDETNNDPQQKAITQVRPTGKRRVQSKGNHNFKLTDRFLFALDINDDSYKISPTKSLKPILPGYLITKTGIEVKTYQDNTSKDTFIASNVHTIANHSIIEDINKTKPTTIYDKIKFFEMYDSYTQEPIHRSLKSGYVQVSENLFNDREDVAQKILIEHVDQSIEEIDKNKIKSKFAKKHIIEENKVDFLNKTLNKSISDIDINLNNNLVKHVQGKPSERFGFNQTETITLSIDENESSILRNKTVEWAEYPFAALYVNETGQMHCDAAAISAHWLIAAGACLARHRMTFRDHNDHRSAYVAYCGEKWWIPERVAYVKNCFVHPGFHPRDRIRRHLYNIGIIEVVSSMASCSGWAPIALMSHQFAVAPQGSMATAVGWGMDRFDPRYAITDLPKTPLTIYKAIVYTESCPGDIEYSKAKYEGQSGFENVYCLSLPPFGEENDLVPGGILLSGGKLIAVYLQEERRPWGAQSAQYTGTWKLVPWVLNVAREPEEMDGLTIEI